MYRLLLLNGDPKCDLCLPPPYQFHETIYKKGYESLLANIFLFSNLSAMLYLLLEQSHLILKSKEWLYSSQKEGRPEWHFKDSEYHKLSQAAFSLSDAMNGSVVSISSK